MSLKALLALSLLFTSPAADKVATASDSTTGDIVVKVENLRNLTKGHLTVALYQKVKRVELDLSKAYKLQNVPVSKTSLTVTFSDLPYGEYAVGILHDMDKNKEMNTNWLGIPREDLAISNNMKGGPFGGPAWEDAKVVLKGPKLAITPIKINHMYKN